MKKKITRINPIAKILRTDKRFLSKQVPDKKKDKIERQIDREAKHEIVERKTDR